uniref:Uncharacterized protein n=1 Tax=Setaria italica TaxID=4555 RepID=K3YX49_SETIT
MIFFHALCPIFGGPPWLFYVPRRGFVSCVNRSGRVHLSRHWQYLSARVRHCCCTLHPARSKIKVQQFPDTDSARDNLIRFVFSKPRLKNFPH